MKNAIIMSVFSLMFFPAAAAGAGSYDAAADYICGAGASEVWSYEGYRASDGTYMEMVFGRAPLTEVTKYGIEAHYLPDSGQPYHPFITKFPGELLGSPSTAGGRFDAVLTWTSPERGKARLSGSAKLIGDMSKNAAGKKIKVVLMLGAKELWSSEVTGGQSVGFEVEAGVSAGDKVHMHLVNAGESPADLTAFNLKVSTGP